jgi:hypothetical protein
MRMRSVIGMVIAAVVPAVAVAQTVFRTGYVDLGGSDPTGIAIGDVDGDGNLDFMTTNFGSQNELLIFPGFGDGTLFASSSLELPSVPTALVRGKFDDDDIEDLVVANANDNSIIFLKGLGNSDFFSPPGTAVTVGASPVGLAAADLNGDGKLDVVTANEGDGGPGSITIMLGDGTGNFHRQAQVDPTDPNKTVDDLPTERGTHAVAIGNIDGEPGLDILALNTGSNTISVYTGDGAGEFTARGTLPTGAGAQDVELADLNNDGKLDLVLAVSNEDAVSVQLGNGDRTFATAQSYPVGNTPTRVSVADMDRNGLLDLVSSNNRSGDVSVLLATAPGVFAAARTFVADAQPEQLGIGDFNNDGTPDVVTANRGASGTVAVITNRGGGVLHAVEDVPAGGAPNDVGVGDVDGDGTVDLVIAGDNGTVVIFSGAADGLHAGQTVNVGGRLLGVTVADLNGDGLADIAAVDGTNNRVAVVLSRGGGRFSDTALYPTATHPGAVTVGDFNNDGRPDLAVSATVMANGPGKASVLLQQANGQFGPAQDTEVEETPIGIAAVHTHCAGRQGDDLVVANLGSDTVSVLRSNGNGTFSLFQTLPGSQVGSGPIAISVADFDRDGIPDFAVADTVAPQLTENVRLFRGSCTDPYAAIGRAHIGEFARALVARDFTGDQIVDLAVVSQTSNEVRLVVMPGDGTLPAGAEGYAVSRMPWAITAGDFDSDGRYDAASANNDPSANNVSVLYNCARDLPPLIPCNPFLQPGPAGKAALRGDGNNDGSRTAADLVAVAREVMDGDGFQVEDIGGGTFNGARVSPGVDANGDGRVDAQDRIAVAHRLFVGA